MRNDNFSVDWVGTGEKPRLPANPDYPHGIRLDLSRGKKPNCIFDLPYPAPNVGHYIISCHVCKISAICIAAGKADDPVSIRIPCRSKD